MTFSAKPPDTTNTVLSPASPAAQRETAGFRYYDGLSAKAHEVTVSATGTHMHLSGEGGASMAVWELDSIALPDDLHPPYSLMHIPDRGERLTVIDAAAHAQIALCLGIVRRTRRTAVLRKWTRACAAIWLLGLGIWFAFPYLTEAVVGMVPLETERALGVDVRNQVGAILGRRMYGDPVWCDAKYGTESLNILLDRLAAAEGSVYAFDVQVVDSSVMNAFAAPGGSILVTSGLLGKIDSAEELAGVLAHEMGHVIERHGLRSMAGVYGLQMVSRIFTGNDGGFMGDATRGLALQMTTSSWSRECERAADVHAFALLRKAGMPTGGLVTFFERLEKEESARKNVFSYLGMLSSHPATVERIRELRAMESEAPEADVPAGPVLSWPRWRFVQNICE